MKRLSKNRLAFIASLNLQSLSHKKVEHIWSKYETQIQDRITYRGKRDALGFYKEAYAFLRNLLLELPTQSIPFCKVDSNGIPKPLWPLRPLIKGDRSDRRLALSIARSYEFIRLPIDEDITNVISTHPRGDVLLSVDNEFRQFLERFTRTRGWYLGSLQTNRNADNAFETLSKGPNGPAVAYAHIDARAVIDDGNLFKNIRNLNLALGQEWITEWLERMAEEVNSSTDYLTGKLGFSAEPGGKTRMFAIGDYWSQTSLKVVQVSLYNTLKKICTDSTADQDKGFKTLLKESHGRRTYCFDLSAASDRIPAIMQKHRLRLLGGDSLADAWHKVMTDRYFTIKRTGVKVKWEVGQPLGLLSSFPSFALWHHDIIQFAANRENFRKGKPLRFFKRYRLLGDDVVIFDDKVAKAYQDLIINEIGLTINISKSVFGDKEKSQIEFAKRLSLNGTEMSSIKHNILSKSDKHSLLDLVDILRERDFISTDTGHYGLLSTLKSEDRELFSFMLWIRSGLSIPFRVSDTCSIDRDSFNRKVKAKRVQNMEAKAMKLMGNSLDMESERIRLKEYYENISVPCSDKALGYMEDEIHGDTISERKEFAIRQHPLVWAITQTSRSQQFTLFDILDDYDPDMSPVEYLPIVSSKSFFHDRKTMTRFLSEIIIDSLRELKDELQLPKDTPVDPEA